MLAHHENRSVLFQPVGRLDLEGGAVLCQQFADIGLKWHGLWIVDLAQVEFIDHAGLIALVTGLTLANKHQCQIVLRNPRPAVRLVFEISRLDEVFEFTEASFEVVGSTVHKQNAVGRSPARPVAA